MATQVVDSTNFEEFAKTGKVPEPPKEDKTEAKAEDKKGDGEKKDEVDEDGLTARERELLGAKLDKIVAKRHRAMKEAEEFSQEQYREKLAAEKRADELEARLKELQSKVAPTSTEKEPVREDFKTDAEYWDAKIDWRAREAVRADRELRAREAQEAAQQAAENAFRERLKASAAEIPDYEDVLKDVEGRSDEPTVAPHIAQYVKESDSPARLLYHFAKHPEELTHLNTLSPIKAIAALGKLEVSFEKPLPKETKDEAAKPPDKTRAPAPIAPISGEAGTVHKDLKDMNTRETIEYWQAREASAKRKRERH